MSDPVISIVIVSWNVREALLSCLRSLERHVTTPHDVVLVDNASTDDTVAAVRQAFPTIISNSQNVGFARANNQGWQKSHGQYICYLNPDTEFVNDPFPVLLEYLRHHPTTGAIGPELRNPDGSHQSSVRRFPTLLDQSIILLKGRAWLGWLPQLRRYTHTAPSSMTEPSVVDQIMGACMLIPRTVVTDAGFWDEGYWIWFEEVDLCRRLKAAGYDVVYDPRQHIIHLGGQSFGQRLSLAKQRWFLRSLWRYATKWWPRPQQIALAALMPVSYMLTIIQSTFKPR